MKVKVSKTELRECIENAVIRALNEIKDETINEAYYDDDDDDSPTLRAFLKDPKNKIKRQKGGNAARKAAMADIKAEYDAEEKDDKAIEKREKSERADED